MEALYHAALEVSGEERVALLPKSDPDLRRAVESLLAQGGSGDVVLDRPAWEQASSLIDPAPLQFAPGDQLGWYRVQAKIGAGGMGEIYRAKDTKLEREVAIKVLPASVAQDPERRIRFGREAKVLAALNHPSIAQIHGVEERALVMELVEGETLQGSLPIDTALNYARQIAEALEAAHDKGTVSEVMGACGSACDSSAVEQRPTPEPGSGSCPEAGLGEVRSLWKRHRVSHG